MFLLYEVDKPANKSITINQSFLCANQIVVCIKHLEMTVQHETKIGTSLITSRQCFFERILWCLARMKLTILSANNQVLIDAVEENFVTTMDSIFELLFAFDDNRAGVGVSSCMNKAEDRAEMMIKSKEIRCLVEKLLSHSLAFANIVEKRDQAPLKVLSQRVLKITLEFEAEHSLAGSKVEHASRSPHQQLKVNELEGALHSLEKFTNEALLRLVFEVFVELNFTLKNHLKAFENIVEAEIDKFDFLIEKLLQIGQFAAAFSTEDHRVAAAIKSSLASLESMDSYLIPAITTNDPSRFIFIAHFQEEIAQLQVYVQQIIDTIAFMSCFMDGLSGVIERNRKEFSASSLVSFIERANILTSHLQINVTLLQLDVDKVAIFYFNDFKLILAECEAILTFPGKIDDVEKRTLKRFRVLLNTTKKLQSAIKNVQNFDDRREDEKMEVAVKERTLQPQKEQIDPKLANYFETIQPSRVNSVLYESKRMLRGRHCDTEKSEVVNSKEPESEMSAMKNLLRKSTRNSKRRGSLRVAMFKKQQEHEMAEEFETHHFNESMNLHITEILDKLAEFPSNF